MVGFHFPACCYFNPRSPWGERLHSALCFSAGCPFQSTLPVGGATGAASCPAPRFLISIHAPRGGSDDITSSGQTKTVNFNPRSPWGERHGTMYFDYTKDNFNPRSPWGERRISGGHCCTIAGFQSTLPVGGATGIKFMPWLSISISIHAPRGGSDWKTTKSVWIPCQFQSTLPVGGATCKRYGQNRAVSRISIHAPRGGSDILTPEAIFINADFNPRSPWGERHDDNMRFYFSEHFNPRSPWGERLSIGFIGLILEKISIHAPRGGSDNATIC